MLVKASPTLVETTDDVGEFTAVVSCFGNIDSYGDVVMPGAFTQTLADWKASGDRVPVLWAHDWSDPFAHIGEVVEAEERPAGLWVRGVIDLTDNPKARQVHRLLKGRRVTQFSFAYDVVKGARAERDGREVYELHELKLHEAGPCLIGVNQETELLTAKAGTWEKNYRGGVEARPEDIAQLVALRQVLDSAIEAAKSTAAPTASPSAAQLKSWADTLVLEGHLAS